jgi:hypothetical protein
MSNFYDNDDDLFEDSSSSTQSSSFHNVFAHSSSQRDEDFDSLIENTKDYAKSKGIGSDSFVLRTGVVTSFYEVVNRFVYETDSLSRSIFNKLNALTNGEYAKELYADVLEESIIKRFAVYEFIDSILRSDNSKSFELAAKHLKIEIDEAFIRIYFGSLFKVMNHAIDRNIDIYQKLCEQINRVPMKAIVDKDYDYFDFRMFSSNSYINQTFESIRDSLGFKTYN